MQQVQLIGGGAHGPQAASAIRHIAAQNGIWSLGNFGGIPPKTALNFNQPEAVKSDQATAGENDPAATTIDGPDYRFVFNSCGIGMAIASMGGAFIDCNQLFSQLSEYNKQELCALTIFNLTARQDLQRAFDQISQLISPPTAGGASEEPPGPVLLRGALKNRTDLGLSISLVKGDDGVSKCFCVILVKVPAAAFGATKPVPASFDSVQAQAETTAEAAKQTEDSSPTFTSG